MSYVREMFVLVIYALLVQCFLFHVHCHIARLDSMVSLDKMKMLVQEVKMQEKSGRQH